MQKAKKAKIEAEAEEDEDEEMEEGDPEAEEEGSDDDEDELPLGVASKMPSNAELEQSTLAILKSVNVIDFSLKQLLRQLGAGRVCVVL